MTDRHSLVSATSSFSPLPRHWWHTLGCALLVVLLSTSMAMAGVVKSTGVKRVVDGPRGEVVVEGVLDTDGTPVYESSPISTSSAPATTPKRENKPKEPNYDKIEYHEQELTPEESTPQESNSPVKLIVVGLLVLLLGLGAVYYMNNKRD